MDRVIITDIFGRTGELEELALRLSSGKGHAAIIDPYDGRDKGFFDEAEAYACFTRTIAMDGYIQKVEDWFKTRTDPVVVIGFSAGASALWAVSSRPVLHDRARAFCFYGSQIRHMADLNPKIETTLFFPVKEDHFDVSQMKAAVTGKPNVEVIQTGYLHGFMNRRSVNFDPEGYDRYLDRLEGL